MSMVSKSRARAVIRAVDEKTGFRHLDLRSAVQFLCDCYNGSVGTETIKLYEKTGSIEALNTLKSMLNGANKKTGVNHANITAAVQTLCDGYVSRTPLYSYGITSDIHVQYATGYSDFQRAVAYFERLNIPHFNAGDLTWAAIMVNADQYTTEWKGGLEDYKDIKGDVIIYVIGGNHETYTATYDVSSGTWTSVGTRLDVDLWKEMTGCEPFYTVSSDPEDTAAHNVYDARIADTDVFIMLSIKQASEPNLFFTADDGEDELAWLETVLEKYKNRRCHVFFHEHDNADLTADPFQVYPAGISEDTEQGAAFIGLIRKYKNVIWYHGHTHTTFEEEYPPVGTSMARGYKTVNIPSLQGPRKYDESMGQFVGDALKSEAYVVDAYENYIVLKCLDLTTVNADGTGEASVMEVYVLDTTLQTMD